MDRFLVTGAGGYVGKKVMDALANDGHTAIGFDIQNADVIGDLAREFQFPYDDRFQNTHLIHLAAKLPGSERKSSLLLHSSQVSENLLKFADRFDRILIVSSTAVYKTKLREHSLELGPWEAYGQAKLRMENDFIAKSKKLSILRPGTILGPDRRGGIVDLLNLASQGKTVILPRKGDITHPFVHVDDVVMSILSWAKVAPEENFSIRSLVAQNPVSMFESILKLTGNEIKSPNIPDFIFKSLGSDSFPFKGISQWHFGALLYDVEGLVNYEENLKFSMIDTIKSALSAP